MGGEIVIKTIVGLLVGVIGRGDAYPNCCVEVKLKVHSEEDHARFLRFSHTDLVFVVPLKMSIKINVPASVNK